MRWKWGSDPTIKGPTEVYVLILILPRMITRKYILIHRVSLIGIFCGGRLLYAYKSYDCPIRMPPFNLRGGGGGGSCGELKISNFITCISCLYGTALVVNYIFHAESLLAQFSLYVHKGGLKPNSFHFHAEFARNYFFQKYSSPPTRCRPVHYYVFSVVSTLGGLKLRTTFWFSITTVLSGSEEKKLNMCLFLQKPYFCRLAFINL